MVEMSLKVKKPMIKEAKDLWNGLMIGMSQLIKIFI